MNARATRSDAARGRLVDLPDGTTGYRIDGVDRLAPFLTTVVSASDHWLFASSTGGLTAGRVDPSRGLFPYESEDRLHVARGIAGPITLLRVRTSSGEEVLWEPFDDRGLAPGRRRSITRSTLGTWLALEEADDALGLVVTTRWATSDRFGFVRTLVVRRREGAPAVSVRLLDGLVHVMPALVPEGVQATASSLVDAYKRAERVEGTSLAIYSLEARLSDRAEPAEALRANVVWSTGLPGAEVHLSGDAIRDFRDGAPARPQPLATGQRGAYLVSAELDLGDRDEARLVIVGDVFLGAVEVEALRALLVSGTDVEAHVAADVAAGERALARLVASADGFALTEDRLATTHQYANVLYNGLRGGVFVRDHVAPARDFARFVAARSRPVAERHAPLLASLADLDHDALREVAARTGDPSLERLVLEYLPLTFGRRHGDPSRPWNRFSIRVKDADGSPRLHYEGNWRDIFQNWEALCASFPGFYVPVVARFANATTLDGHAPYRVTREGIDWEVPDPHEPWANIGYWGDHPIIYLARLVDAAERTRPGSIGALLGRRLFTYADVPYRIRPYEDLVRDAKATVVFDAEAERRVRARVAATGEDGRFVHDARGDLALVTLAEKLVVPLLAKLSNLVADGGIWLNTQRPEWNDANNALVGHGLSVVTLAHLRRYLVVLAALFAEVPSIEVGSSVARWLDRVDGALLSFEPALAAPRVSDAVRGALLDALGRAGADHRAAAYTEGVSEPTTVAGDAVRALVRRALAYVDHGLRANRREDGLFHAYNLLARRGAEIAVEPLYEMLEGQVAVLGSGLLGPDEAIALVDALHASALYRPDQRSFLLYPSRALPGFLAKNRAPEAARALPLVRALSARRDDSVLAEDARGALRFAPDLRDARDLDRALDALASDPGLADLVAADREALVDAFEATFRHHAFTGRSGTMHRYEGIGCIYWHMVAKLLLAVGEIAIDAATRGAPPETVAALAAAYERVRAGLGTYKSPAVHGAFPTEPYSHTPAHVGAQQPGMTGQVKEEVLARFAELGLRVDGGRIAFTPTLFRASELLTAPARFAIPSTVHGERVVDVPAGAVAFTFCGVPVVVRAARAPRVEVVLADGLRRVFDGATIGASTSAAIFARRGQVAEVRVDLVLPEGAAP